MARTPLTINMITRRGAALVAEPADTLNGNSLACAVPLLVSFSSPNGGTVTIRNPGFFDGLVTDGLKIPDRIITLPIATLFLWGCAPGPYSQPDGFVYLDFAQPTNVSVYQF